MPTVQSPNESTIATEEEFLAIVCSDQDLLRAEFDAIIFAAWPSPPLDPAAGYDALVNSPDAKPNSPGSDLPQQAGPHHPGTGGRSRQRSPPPPKQMHPQGTKEGDVPSVTSLVSSSLSASPARLITSA